MRYCFHTTEILPVQGEPLGLSDGADMLFINSLRGTSTENASRNFSSAEMFIIDKALEVNREKF